MPNCTIIKTGATITSTPSERVSELKSLIDGISLPVLPTVGDICFYDSTVGSLIIVSYDVWSADPSAYPLSRYTPIGVVVIPQKHNVYGDGTCGVVSLKWMDCSAPDEGSASYTYMYWGYNSLLLGDALDQCVVTGTCAAPTVEATGYAANPYIVSDRYTGTVCPTDPEAFYYTVSASNSAAPSPYLEDGGRNPVYYQTTDPTSEANCLSDFDGVGNTQLMLNAVTVEGWQTASTISNSYSSGSYPSACCCWRYHTAGTNQGDWYLPACGEAVYVAARSLKIDNTITALINEYGSDIGVTIYTTQTTIYLGSSTEYSSSNARYVHLRIGSVNYTSKNGNYSVRAFLRV